METTELMRRARMTATPTQILTLSRRDGRWFAEPLAPRSRFAIYPSPTPLPESLPADPTEALAAIQRANPQYTVILEG